MSAPKCDWCKGNEYTAENPFVKYCQERPSDPMDMCCTMWGHWSCMGGGEKPYKAVLPSLETGDRGHAVATPEDLEIWIEKPETQKMGYLFIT